MISKKLEYCCGVDFLYSFSPEDLSWTTDKMEAWLRNEIQYTIAHWESVHQNLRFKEIPDHGNRPIKLLIINSMQRKFMNEILNELGFKIISQERNLNSGRTIYFYLWNYNNVLENK